MVKIKEFEKKKLYELLSLSLSRYKDREIIVTDAIVENCSRYPTKSICYKLSRIGLKEGEQEEIPAAIFFKVYRPDRGKGNKLFIGEYKNEKAILEMAYNLKCNIEGMEEVRIFPECYSLKIPECDRYMCFFKEFVEEPSLRTIADEKRRELKWEDIKNAVRQISLLHVNTPRILNEIPVLKSTNLTKDDLGKSFLKYIGRITKANGELLDVELQEKIKYLFSEIANKYLTDKRLESVINGDLNLYPHHLTNNVMLDAGSVGVGPFTADLAVFGSPVFNKGELKLPIENKMELALKEYLENREKIADILKYENHQLVSIPKDFLIESSLVAVLFGAARKAASTLNYKLSYINQFEHKISSISWLPKQVRTFFRIGDKPRLEIEKEVRSHVSCIFDIFNFFKQQSATNFSDLENCLEQAKIKGFHLSSKYNPKKYVYEPVGIITVKNPNENLDRRYDLNNLRNILKQPKPKLKT